MQNQSVYPHCITHSATLFDADGYVQARGVYVAKMDDGNIVIGKSEYPASDLIIDLDGKKIEGASAHWTVTW